MLRPISVASNSPASSRCPRSQACGDGVLKASTSGEHDRRTAEVAEPPRARHPQNPVERNHVMDGQRQRSDYRADRRRDRERREHAGHAGRGVERRPWRHEPAQQRRADHDLEQVAEALPDRGADGQRRVVVDEQIAEDHRGPQPQPEPVQPRDPDPDREPHDRRHRAGEPERVAEVGREVIRGDQDRELGPVGTSKVPARHRQAAASEQAIRGCAARGAPERDAGHSVLTDHRHDFRVRFECASVNLREQADQNQPSPCIDRHPAVVDRVGPGAA